MKSDKEALEESRDYWTKNADDDKKSLFQSLAMVVPGVALIGIGINTILSGNVPGGILEVGIGSGITLPLGRVALSEIQGIADSAASAAVVQYRLDQLNEQPELDVGESSVAYATESTA